jgi:hypothetical protein
MNNYKKNFFLIVAGLLVVPTICYGHGLQGVAIVTGQAGVMICFLVAALIGRKTWQGGVCILVLAASVLSWPLVAAFWGNLLPHIAVLTAIAVPLVAGASAYVLALQNGSKHNK